jgi:hypothetical protein
MRQLLHIFSKPKNKKKTSRRAKGESGRGNEYD